MVKQAIIVPGATDYGRARPRIDTEVDAYDLSSMRGSTAGDWGDGRLWP